MRDEHISGVCLLVAVILWIMTVAFWRAKRKNWSLAVIPLGIVPLVTGVGMVIAEDIFNCRTTFVVPMILIVTSLVGACIWIGFASAMLIKTKKMRAYYIIVAVGFVCTFSIIVLIKYYNFVQAVGESIQPK